MNGDNFEQGRIAVLERINTPDFTAVEAAGQRRRGRQRLAGVAAFAVAAVVSVGAVTLATHEVPRILPASGAVAGPIAAVEWPMTAASFIAGQYAWDGKQSYAVLDTKNSRTLQGPFALAHTSDGGKTWQAWLLPPQSEKHLKGGVVVTRRDGSVVPGRSGGGADTVTMPDVLVLNENTVLAGNAISRDMGHTWAAVPKDPGGAVGDVAPGWVLIAGDDNKLAAIDPETGVRHPLTHAPAMAVRPVPTGDRLVVPAKDGSLWVAGELPDGTPTVAVSHDHGASWKTHTFTGQASGDHFAASFDGSAGYLLLAGKLGVTTKLAVTTDGGDSWGTPAVVTGLPMPVGLAVAANGALLSVNIGAPWGSALISRDSGKTFANNPAVPSTNALVRTASGGYVYLTTGPPQGPDAIPDRVSYSPDGTTFTFAPLPPNAH